MDIFFFSGTHWDREWYQTFQGFRFRLVAMMDDLIHNLETLEDYGVFHLDGQTIALEDYLEIRPENKERLQKLIRQGKLVLGPWYCMPDEFLVSGESLIKNLKRGFKLSREYMAEPMKYGYMCDIFGHIAQMPQIFKGFGINHALLGRGTNEHTTPMHFLWSGLDGSAVTTFKLADYNGYGSFSGNVMNMENTTAHLTEDALRARIKKLVDYEINRANAPVIVLMDAIDHAVLHKETGKYLAMIRALYPQARVFHDNIERMAEKLEKHKHNFTVKKGELNETAKEKCSYLHLITHTLSSRYPLKQHNDILQTKLEKWVQPIYAFHLAQLPDTYLALADKYLLQNHPHDSICGCSIDQVHKDMQYRFDQAGMLCDLITGAFADSMKSGKGDTGKKTLAVFNPLPYADKRVIEADVYFETDYPQKYQEPFGYEAICSFKLFDGAGREVPYGISHIKTNTLRRLYNQKTQISDRYTLVFEAQLAPMAAVSFEIVPFEKPSRYLQKIRHTENTAENAHIALKINSGGSIDIYDKATQTCYRELLTPIDDGEIGDGWYHVNPACDRVVTCSNAAVELVEKGPCRVVFKLTQSMRLPAGVTKSNHGIKRSGTYVDCNVVHYISLGKDEKWVTVKTKVHNNAMDHRLRIKLPTGIEGGRYYANQAFGFVERKAGVDISTQDWRECEVLEKQMGGIVFKRDGKKGLAFISQYGLHECAVTEAGEIYITLFRSFSKTVMTDGEQGGQLLEGLEFSYMIYPCDADTSFAELQKRQDFFQAGEMCINDCSMKGRHLDPIMTVSSKHTLFSTANKAENGVTLRFYNLSGSEDTVAVDFAESFSKAFTTDLDDNILAKIEPLGGQVKLSLKPWEIVTFLLQY